MIPLTPAGEPKSNSSNINTFFGWGGSLANNSLLKYLALGRNRLSKSSLRCRCHRSKNSDFCFPILAFSSSVLAVESIKALNCLSASSCCNQRSWSKSRICWACDNASEQSCWLLIVLGSSDVFSLCKPKPVITMQATIHRILPWRETIFLVRGKKANAKHIHAGHNSHLKSFTIAAHTVRTNAAPNPTKNCAVELSYQNGCFALSVWRFANRFWRRARRLPHFSLDALPIQWTITRGCGRCQVRHNHLFKGGSVMTEFA